MEFLQQSSEGRTTCPGNPKEREWRVLLWDLGAGEGEETPREAEEGDETIWGT